MVAVPGIKGVLAARNRSAVPSACRIARPSGSGVHITSPPRMLNAQASDAGAVIMAASAPSSRICSASAARLSAELTPTYSSGCGTTGAMGAAGLPVHAASSGLGDVARNTPPARVTAFSSAARSLGLTSWGS